MKDNLDDKLVYAIADENYYEESTSPSDYKNKSVQDYFINYGLEGVPDTMYPLKIITILFQTINYIFKIK